MDVAATIAIRQNITPFFENRRKSAIDVEKEVTKMDVQLKESICSSLNDFFVLDSLLTNVVTLSFHFNLGISYVFESHIILLSFVLLSILSIQVSSQSFYLGFSTILPSLGLLYQQ
jgi:hypothetical protein